MSRLNLPSLSQYLRRTFGIGAAALSLAVLPACQPPDGALEAEAGDEAGVTTQALCPIDEPDCLGPITTGPCSTAASRPLYSASYACDLALKDLFDRPVAGKTVTLRATWCNVNGDTALGTATAVTGSDGRAHVSLATTRANILSCAVSTTDGIVTGATKSSTTYLASGTTVGPVAASQYPTPNATASLTGLVSGAGSAALYQSGGYDKVVVIPEYFDQKENDSTRRRTRKKFFDELKTLLVDHLYPGGYDVWLFEPRHTGDNLHEQAAELAQAIRVAAQYNGGPSCGNGKVSVLGLSTGAVPARIATARWEADSAWRTALGLPTVLPVNLVMSGDAPQYGMNLNVDLQRSLYDHKSGTEINKETNFDSCAATQLMRTRVNAQNGSTTQADFLNFWVNGAATSFYSKLDGTVHTCAAGPAVARLNAANGVPGWPAGPRRYGWANSSRSAINECYGDDRDKNAHGDNLCKYKSDFTSALTFTPSLGQSWMKIAIDWASDQYMDADRADDLVTGSRNPFFLDGYGGHWSWFIFGGDIHFRQRFATTLIPWKSAAGTEGPVGSNAFGTVSSPFADADFVDGLYNASADTVNFFGVLGGLNRLSTVTASTTCQPVIFQPITVLSK